MLALLILGFLVIIAVEVPGMAMKEQRGELWAFWALLAIGFGLSLAVVQEWPVPNPTVVLEAVFKPFAMMTGIQ